MARGGGGGSGGGGSGGATVRAGLQRPKKHVSFQLRSNHGSKAMIALEKMPTIVRKVGKRKPPRKLKSFFDQAT